MREAENTDLETLILEVTVSGGAETANTQIFIDRLTKALDLPTPDFAGEKNERNDYTFERRVDFKHPDGTTTIGRIDLYRRNSFILEAKQSSKRSRDDRQLDMLGEDARQKKTGTAKRDTRGWDKAMRAARKQAEGYARALPVEHGYPPFLLVLDVGNVLEIYADFSGQGKNYAQFPDRSGYRIHMDDLRDPVVQARLRAIWLDPTSLNPALVSAKVTRDIAQRLAKIAKTLEGKYPPENVAHFLMRCLFTMFAEDVELIEKHSFETLLKDLIDKPQTFPAALENLWKQMDAGGYDARTMTVIRHFNGGLFSDCRALPLDGDAISELWIAAKRDWSDVEPAIFGTLLEQALDPRERGKLGAHYTPRAYVERLVIPTIIEPLREDWEDVLARATELHEAGLDTKALRAVQKFHRQLCTTRVLDPACGTGNFLYVSLELMKRLEGEVLEVIRDFGGAPSRIQDFPEEFDKTLTGTSLERKGSRFTVDPHLFYGLDLNERAVAIADLVLWLGYIKWQLKTSGIDSISDPVLEKLGNIRHQDAILSYKSKTVAMDDDGAIISRWNGYTMKPHPVTGNPVPDPDARVEAYVYDTPKRAEWPEAEFIVGNPPFIGGKDMRAELGDGYAEAAWKARPKVPGGADFVMHFWDEAAQRLARNPTKAKPNPLRRFGFITTNSITQTFSRRVVEAALSAKSPISLIYAVADHPWMKGGDKAAVRIAMTVAERGESEGLLGSVLKEEGLGTDTPNVALASSVGLISPSLRLGPNLSDAVKLIANDSLAFRGICVGGQGFVLKQAIPSSFNKQDSKLIKAVLNGRDIANRSSGRQIIDAFGITEGILKSDYPNTYQFLKDNVFEQRQQSQRQSYRDNWWIFMEPRPDLRDAIKETTRFLVTPMSAKHRMFLFKEPTSLPDQGLIALASDRNEVLSVISSRFHVEWSIRKGGWLGVGNDPRYNNTQTFDPFPFPACVTDDSNPALRDRLSTLGERLDAHRKRVMQQHDHLTMTGMYNVLERVRERYAGIGEELTDSERDVYDAAQIAILMEIHDDIDRAVLEAYGWSDLAPALVGKVGATLPSPHKLPEQEAAEEELLTRLVALNIERRDEERRGHVRWLRPEYQIPKLSHKIKSETADMDVTPVITEAAPAWPSDGLDQIRIVRDLLIKSNAPVSPDAVSATFKGRNSAKRKERVSTVLETLVATGLSRITDDKEYFSIR